MSKRTETLKEKQIKKRKDDLRKKREKRVDKTRQTKPVISALLHLGRFPEKKKAV